MIYNPAAGRVRRSGGRLLQRSISALESAGLRVTPVATTGPRTAASLAAKCITEGADLILALGGDGTINEITNGMVHSQVPLGILPGGTANVLGMELRLGGNAEKAAQMFSEFVPVRIAAGLMKCEQAPDPCRDVTPRYFLLMAGIGLDAYIVYNLDLRMKARMGKLAYWAGGFSQVGRRLAEFDVIADGCSTRASFALVSRVRNYGGDLEIAYGANLLDDAFELVLFEGDNATRYLAYFAGVLTRRLKGMKGVTVRRIQKLEIPCGDEQGVYIQIDGEYAGKPPASIEIVPDALTLLVPKPYLDRAEEWRRANQFVA